MSITTPIFYQTICAIARQFDYVELDHPKPSPNLAANRRVELEVSPPRAAVST